MSEAAGPWSVERACAWWDGLPWLVGCNYIPSTAINQLEMWQAESFDLETNEREIAWAAGLGFNCIRVYLHDLLWEQDPEGFAARIDRFLEMTWRHGIRVMFVLFDDVWNTEPALGAQPAPHPGRHNSGWVQGPGLGVLNAYTADAAIRRRLEAYVTGVVSRFGADERVLIWDVYNEPGGYPSPVSDPVGGACLPLLADVFTWARAARPGQPLTSGQWWNPMKPSPPEICELQRAQSDVVSFHHYGPVDDLEKLCDRLRAETERPLLCTEYLARDIASRFETHLPVFQARKIAAISWGLVSGKTQTIFPWWSWFPRKGKDGVEPPASDEPKVWFHDILRPDGTPYDAAEASFLRKLLT